MTVTPATAMDQKCCACNLRRISDRAQEFERLCTRSLFTYVFCLCACSLHKQSSQMRPFDKHKLYLDVAVRVFVIGPRFRHFLPARAARRDAVQAHCLHACLSSSEQACIHTQRPVRHKLYAMGVGDRVFVIFSVHARRGETPCRRTASTHVPLRLCLLSEQACIHTRRPVRHKLYAMGVGWPRFRHFLCARAASRDAVQTRCVQTCSSSSVLVL